MGFYLELKRNARVPSEFIEAEIPSTFWVLYTVAGFALTCMGVAAFALLIDLARTGSKWDQVLVITILTAVPIYTAIGLKLAGLRKFVNYSTDSLQAGYRLFGMTVFRRVVSRAEIVGVSLLNKKPSQNVAPLVHDDKQYYLRGHWRVVLQLKNGRLITIDKHTEEAALYPLYENLQKWWAAH